LTLTNREKKIVLIKYIIHGVSPFDSAPLGKRVKMLKAAVEKCGMKYDDDELQLIGQECLALQGELNNIMMDYISDNKDLVVKAHQEINKGNDGFKKELGDDLADEGLEILKKKKWYEKF